MGKRKDTLRAFQLEVSEAMRKNKHGYKTLLKRVQNKVFRNITRSEHESTLESLVVKKWSSKDV